MSVSHIALNEIAEINPKGPSKNELSPNDIVDFVPMAFVSESGTMTVESQKPYAEVAKGYTAFKNHDVLIAKITPCFENNKITQAKISTTYAYGSTEFHIVRSNPAKLDAGYLTHFLRQDYIRKTGERRMTGSGGQRRVPKTFLEDLKIPLPPLEEQKRIAGILDQADALCRLRRRALDRLNTLGQAIFHEMFGDRQSVSRAVEQLGEVQGGLQVSKKRDIHKRRAPYLRVANVYRDQLKLEEIKTIGLTDSEAERTKLQSGDVLIVEGHGNPEEIGRTAVWNEEIDHCVHQNHLIRFRPDQIQILPQFFSSYMNSMTGRKHLTSSSRTTTGLNTISAKKVKECIIPVPSLQDQQSFLTSYQAVEKQISTFTHLHLKQQTLFASLQHRAFRGEL